jgi:hypothetical protein
MMARALFLKARGVAGGREDWEEAVKLWGSFAGPFLS